jgi:hypothetical protein
MPLKTKGKRGRRGKGDILLFCLPPWSAARTQARFQTQTPRRSLHPTRLAQRRAPHDAVPHPRQLGCRQGLGEEKGTFYKGRKGRKGDILLLEREEKERKGDILLLEERKGDRKEKGTFYFYASFGGRPRGRRLDSRPRRRAARSIQLGSPNGVPRTTLCRTRANSAAVKGSCT